MSRLAGRLAALAARALHRRGPPPHPTPRPDHALIENVAGTLRDALSAIRGFSELLARGEAADTAAATRFILESSEELNRYLANLQDFMRHEQGRLSLCEQQVDAAELVESALSACRGTAERADVTILAHLVEDVDLACDPPRIRAAVANIVLWMVARSAAGSLIVLRLLRTREGGMTIAVTGMVDTSPADSLFEPGPDMGGLTGFSLPVARRVALLHAGELTAQHGSGGVLTLHLALPPGRVISPQRADACERCAA